MRTNRSALAATVMFLACVTTAWAEDAAQIVDRLHRAEKLNSLDDATLKPWHLKLNFQLFDAKGNPSEQGTIEEWWRSPSSFKIIYTSPSYTATEIKTPEGLYRSKGEPSPPFLPSLALREIVHPLSRKDIDESKPDLRRESFGKVPVDCIMLSQEIKQVAYLPLGLFPTFCFDQGQESLRASSNFGTQLTIRNRIGRFQEHTVPTEETINLNTVNAISTHIEILRGEVMPDAEFKPSDDFEDADLSVVKVANGVMAGLILSQPKPIYPERAKALGISGSVQIGATIGIDGRIHSMKLISVPDPDLAIAAISAVRQWTYKPYTLKGMPVEVETTITVNFKIGL